MQDPVCASHSKVEAALDNFTTAMRRYEKEHDDLWDSMKTKVPMWVIGPTLGILLCVIGFFGWLGVTIVDIREDVSVFSERMDNHLKYHSEIIGRAKK